MIDAMGNEAGCMEGWGGGGSAGCGGREEVHGDRNQCYGIYDNAESGKCANISFG